MLLQDVKSATSNIFDGEMGLKELKVPVPPTIWKDKLDALEEAKLINQRESMIFDMRKWQAKEMGFVEVNSNDMVKMLMGDFHTETDDGPTRQDHEWAYNHHEDEMLSNNWGGKPTIFKRVVRDGLWSMPPFVKRLKWECHHGKLDYLKREIPYGVVLRINECKQLKLFNVFSVFAPKEAWEKKTDIDPIVVATIWELPSKVDEKTKERTRTNAGQVAHYFLAQW